MSVGKNTAMSQHPPIQIVNTRDEPIGGASMHEAYSQGLIHRIVYVIVEDPAGHILLQKRSAHVATNKNRWDISVGGHVDQGEDYKQAAERELHEELGLKDLKLNELQTFYRETHDEKLHLKRFIRAYKTQIERSTPIHFPQSEISEIQWVTLKEARELVKNQPELVSNGLVECLEECY